MWKSVKPMYEDISNIFEGAIHEHEASDDLAPSRAPEPVRVGRGVILGRLTPTSTIGPLLKALNYAVTRITFEDPTKRALCWALERGLEPRIDSKRRMP